MRAGGISPCRATTCGARSRTRRDGQARQARARAEFDLAIVSVLLDAGAGPDWSYRDAVTGFSGGRSEGLAIASLRMFEAGAFSSDPGDPLRADADKLSHFTAAQLAAGFQARDGNPLAGLEGRAALLARLGNALKAAPDVFAISDSARPGGLFDLLARNANGYFRARYPACAASASRPDLAGPDRARRLLAR